MTENWDAHRAALALADGGDHKVYEDTLRAKLTEGKGIALYRNEDLGHPGIGHTVGFTYGHATAQFEGAPPEQCPDGLMGEITGGINWRYRLIATVPPVEGGH